MNPLTVRASKLQPALAGLLGLFFVPCGLLVLVDGLMDGRYLVPLVGSGLLFGTYAIVFGLVLRGHVMAVKRFTPDGLVRGDGRRLPWSDLSHVVTQLHRNRPGAPLGVWRREIHFKGGQVAWILPLKVSNYAEVSAYVDALPCEHREVRV